MPHLKAVGGWGFQSFDSKVDESSDQIELRENSFLFGFELRLPYGGERLSYLIYAGGIAGQLSIENKVLALDTRSDYQLGWELGLGAQYQLDENWALKPQLRYRELTGSFALGANTFEEALRYLSLSISVSYAL